MSSEIITNVHFQLTPDTTTVKTKATLRVYLTKTAIMRDEDTGIEVLMRALGSNEAYDEGDTATAARRDNQCSIKPISGQRFGIVVFIPLDFDSKGAPHLLIGHRVDGGPTKYWEFLDSTVLGHSNTAIKVETDKEQGPLGKADFQFGEAKTGMSRDASISTDIDMYQVVARLSRHRLMRNPNP